MSRTLPIRIPFLIVLGVVAVAFAIYVWRTQARPPSRVQVAEDCLRFILEGNVRGLLRYISPQEAEALNIDEAGLEQFFQNIVKPKLAGFEPTSIRDVKDGPSLTMVLQELRHKDGRSTWLKVHVVGGPDGRPVVHRFLYDCLLSALLADLPPDPSRRPPAVRLFAAIQPPLESLLPRLKAMKIRGVYVQTKVQSNANMETFDWEEFLQFLKRRTEK